MYILYTVDARYMPGIYIIKLRYYLPYLTFFSATLTRANEE